MFELTTVPDKTPVLPEYADLADAPGIRGYDTAFGFLAKTNPELLGFLDDPVAAIFEEYEALLALCTKRGLQCVEALSPSAVRERGFKMTFAFPNEVLEAHFQ